MAQIVNLGRVRKAKAKDSARAKADENAVKFGRTKAARDLEQAQAAKAARDLNGHQRDPDRRDPE
jgi:hypothetical protein